MCVFNVVYYVDGHQTLAAKTIYSYDARFHDEFKDSVRIDDAVAVNLN